MLYESKEKMNEYEILLDSRQPFMNRVGNLSPRDLPMLSTFPFPLCSLWPLWLIFSRYLLNFS
jgi:hypothetical protein